MQFTDKLFGSNLMHAITSGLYSGKLECIREYIQNAWDPNANANDVWIRSENEGVNWIIEDNGNGMDEEELKKALGVGLYTKNMFNTEGIFGIGIWSGVAVCDKLVIITKKRNMREKLRIEIFAKKIREESTGNLQILQFLTDRTSEIEHIPVENNEIKKSYTIARLEGITSKDIFAKEKIIKFVSENLPVPIDPSFKYTKEVAEYVDNKIFRTINIYIEGSPVYRLQNIKNKILEPIKSSIIIDNEVIAELWYSVSNNGDAIKGTRGLTLKHNGFTVKNWPSLRSLIGGRFNERYVGEIHIKSSKLRPTANRNDLQPNEVTTKLFDVVRKFLSSLQRVNSYQTVNIFSPLKKIKKAKTKTLPEKIKTLEHIKNKNFTENVSSLEKDNLVGPLIKQLKPFEKEAQKKFEDYEKYVHNEINTKPPTKGDYKKFIPTLFITERLKNMSSILMQEKQINKMTINPFNELKEKIEKKVDKKFDSFTKACDEIGNTLTLFKHAREEKKNNNEIIHLFKAANKIFRNYFEHASGTPQTKWFMSAPDKGKLKAAILCMIALFDQMIDLMEPVT